MCEVYEIEAAEDLNDLTEVLGNKENAVLLFRLLGDGLSALLSDNIKAELSNKDNKVNMLDIRLKRKGIRFGKFQIGELPEILFLKNGKIIDSITGVFSRNFFNKKYSEIYQMK